MLRRRRGSVLVLALLVSASASIMGIYLLLTTDLRSRANRYLGQAASASRLAFSGLQLARIHLGEDAEWPGEVFPDPERPEAEIAVVCEPTEFLRAQAAATGRIGAATQSVQAELRAVGHPALDFRAFAASGVVFEDAALSGAVRTNGDVTVVGAVDFAGTIETVTGAQVDPEIPPGQVVYVDDPLDGPAVNPSEYAALSTPIFGLPYDKNALGEKNGAFVLERTSLRPDANPYGGTNAEGAYHFSAAGRSVLVRDVYVLGTLTITDCDLLRIEGGFHLERASARLASIVCDGPIEMALDADLDELGMGIDFDGDGDFLDVHPRLVEGVIWTASSFSGPLTGELRGTLVADSIVFRGTPKMTSNGAISVQPVLGFVQPGPWDIVVGSIQQGTGGAVP